jgi:hypothetical protein
MTKAHGAMMRLEGTLILIEGRLGFVMTISILNALDLTHAVDHHRHRHLDHVCDR